MKTSCLIIISILCLNLFCSCSDEPSKIKEDIVKIDSTANKKVDTIPQIEFSSDAKALISLFKEESTLPFEVNDKFYEKVVSFDSIGINEVKLLNEKWFSHDLNNRTNYYPEVFLKIDSAKNAGLYYEYISNNDGIIYSNAYALNKLELNPKTIILIWGITFATHDACPYSSGTVAYVTIIFNGKIEETTFLGIDMGAADAPMSMDKKAISKIESDGKISINIETIEEDGYAELTKEKYELEIIEGKYKLISELKEKPKKIKRNNS